jgi:hypothetical protein
MEKIIVMLIISGAAVYLIRSFYNSLKKGGCSCGCSSCNDTELCDKLPENRI